MGYVVISLFDGISCGQIALQKAGISVKRYYASEISKTAIAITQKNFPNTIQLGDVNEWKSWNIDLDPGDKLIILGGSPCQGFSHSGKGLNFKDPRSKLFFTFVDILNHYKPDYWLLENVIMKDVWRDTITQHLPGKPKSIFIDSAVLAPSMRKRNYWSNFLPANFTVAPPKNKKSFSSYLDPSQDKSGRSWKPANIVGRKLDSKGVRKDYDPNIKITQVLNVRKNTELLNCLTTVQKDTILSVHSPGTKYIDVYNTKTRGVDWRYLSAVEAERMLTIPDNYTELPKLAESSRHSHVGNAWTVDIIVELLKQI